MITIKQLKTIGIALLLGIMFSLGYCSNKGKERYEDLKSNYELVQDSLIKSRKLNDSIMVYERDVNEINIKAFNTLFKAIRQDFEYSTGRNIRDLRSALKTQVNSKDSFFFYVTDTLSDIKPFSYKDKFNNIDGAIVKDGVFVNIDRKLYLTSYTYSKRKGEPWYKPWRWGTKLTTDVRSDNPKDSIAKIESIVIEK